MSNEQRSLAAIVLCVLFYLGYDYYLKSKYPEYGKRPDATVADGTQPSSTPTQNTDAGASQSMGADQAPAPAAPQLSADDLTIGTDDVIYRFSQDLSGLERVTLRDYRAAKDPDAPFVELLDGPLALQGITDTAVRKPLSGVFRAERQDRTLRFIRDQGSLRITNEFSVPSEGYGATLRVSYTNTGSSPTDITGGLLFTETVKPKESGSIMGFIPGVVTERVQVIHRADGSTEWSDIESFCQEGEEPLHGSTLPLSYLGIDRHYFLAVAEPKAKSSSFVIDHGLNQEAGCPVAMLAYDQLGSLPPGETTTLEYALYFGPKEMGLMKEHNAELETAMHLGVFEFIARPLLLVIDGFRRVLGNYGVAIILLTFCLKVLFYPLTRASTVSAFKMRKLNPEIQALREKYKDDKQRQQQEMMKLWVQHKINPMKGCLPVLPQIPVFFAFYQVLQTSIQLRHAPFYGWIQDLSAMDPFFVTPILMGVAMMAQQKLTPTTGMDKTQEKILMFMPIMFTAMMLTLPAGLTLYMLTNTVTGIAQQKWLYHKLEKSGV